MARSLVVCPATESLELIEGVDSPLGLLIHACSRFRPATALTCDRRCAQQGRYALRCSGAVFEIEEGDDTELDVVAAPAAPGPLGDP